MSQVRDMSKAEFANSAVATVDINDFKAFVTDQEWTEVLEPFLSLEAWERSVLKEDWREHARQSRTDCRPPKFTIEQQRSLFVKGYVKRTRHGKFYARIFAVWKSDGITLRLIWNGKGFNAACRPPPKFTITPLPEMLQKLLQPGVEAYLAFDATTWFVQFDVPDEISQFFATVLWDGREVVLRGVPMGAAWACALAQTMTIGLARAICEELTRRGIEVPLAVEVCIDNTIFGVRRAEDVGKIKEVVKETAARLKVVLKESAFEEGTSVDWLAYRLDAKAKVAIFKDSFKEKSRAAAVVADQCLTGKQQAVVHDVWCVGGLAMFACYASRTSMRVLKPVVEWLSSSSPRTLAEWRREVPSAGAPWGLLRDFLQGMAGLSVAPPPVPTMTVKAWFVTDASTSGSNAIVWVVDRKLGINVYECKEQRIEARELQAHVKASLLVAGQVSDGYVVGFGDNVVALVARRKGYSMWAREELAKAVEQTREIYDKRKLTLIAPYVPTAACIADVWTRVQGLQIQKEWQCEGVHPHVAGVLCEEMKKKLLEWSAEGIGGSEKLEEWSKGESEWVPAGPSDLLRQGALAAARPQTDARRT